MKLQADSRHHPRAIAFLTLWSILALPPASGATELFAGRGFAIGLTPNDLVLADFDGDTTLDAVAPGRLGDHVAFIPGFGDGTFGTELTTPVGSNPVAIDAGDLDGDGVLDVVTADFGEFIQFGGTIIVIEPPSVSVLLGNGDGTFTAAAPVSAGAAPTDVVAADFDGDGDLDLAVGDGLDSELSILIGNGDGTFSAATKIPLAAAPGYVEAAYIDGGTALDLVVAVAGSIEILEGNGDGTFGAGSVLTPTVSPSTIAVIDINGDTAVDVISMGGSLGPGEREVFLANGDGTFASSGGAVPISRIPIVSAAGDLDGDGKLDLATVGNSVLTVTLGNGDGTFGIPTDMPVGGTGATALTVADANGDGVTDLLAVSSDTVVQTGRQVLVGRWLRFFPGLGGGRFGGTSIAVTPPTTSSSLIDLAPTDWNGDGHNDLVVALADGTSGAPGSVGVKLGNGDGTFQVATFTAAGEDPVAMALADLDGDAVLDVAVANAVIPPSTPSGVTILLGDGLGGLGTPAFYATAGRPTSIDIADLDGAGGVDVVAAAPNAIEVLLGVGDGTFGAATSYPALGPTIRDLALADYDGNGSQDALVLSGSGAALIPGNGDGTFGAAASVPLGGSGLVVSAADMDDDGSIDLVVLISTASEPEVHVLLGNGDGTFGTPTILPTPFLGGCCLELHDIDSDGELDIVTRDGGHDIVVFTANGDGSFASNGPYPAAVDDAGVAIADFDGDGRPDIASGGDLGAFSAFAGEPEGISLIFQLAGASSTLPALGGGLSVLLAGALTFAGVRRLRHQP